METLFSLFSIKTIMWHIPLGSGYNLSYIEAAATLIGLICIWLGSREKIANYPFGIINVALFSSIFFQVQLYANMMLQFYFLVVNIYGWYAWSRADSHSAPMLKIRWMSKGALFNTALIAVVGIWALTFNIDWVFSSLTKMGVHVLNGLGAGVTLPAYIPDGRPFLDSMATVLSVIAMFLMTRKFVENWLIWVFIDIISVCLYSAQGIYVVALEYVILTVIAISGSWNWIQTARVNKVQL